MTIPFELKLPAQSNDPTLDHLLDAGSVVATDMTHHNPNEPVFKEGLKKEFGSPVVEHLGNVKTDDGHYSLYKTEHKTLLGKSRPGVTVLAEGGRKLKLRPEKPRKIDGAFELTVDPAAQQLAIVANKAMKLSGFVSVEDEESQRSR